MAFLAAALSGPALAQDSGQGTAQDAGRERGRADGSGSSSGGSWADEVRSAIGRGGQGGSEAPVRSDMTGSTGKGAPGKPDTK
jgi:hypothetical protein